MIHYETKQVTRTCIYQKIRNERIHLLKDPKTVPINPYQNRSNYETFCSKTENKSGLLKRYLIIWLISIQILIFLSFKTIYWDLTHFLVSIKQAGVLNYFQLIYTPACLIHPARLIILKILYTGVLNRYCSFNRYLRVCNNSQVHIF